MKYFIFTYLGDGLPIAYKLQKEGHDVVVGIVRDIADTCSPSEEDVKPEDVRVKERRLSLYDNMLTKVSAWDLVDQIKARKSYEDCFVLFDRNDLFRFADAIKHLPIAGNFPTEHDYLLEQDRDEAKQFVKKYYPNVSVSRVHEFSKVADAKDFLHKTRSIWVLKGRNYKAKTFIPDIEDYHLAARQIIRVLETSKGVYENGGFILERFVDPLIEITPVKIYYDGVPVLLVINIENKPFGSGNTSVQTGCAQDLVFPISLDDEISKIAFPPKIDELAKEHKGYFNWDASLLIDQKTGKMYFGEFCSNRPGYNEIFTMMAQCPTVSNYFERIVKKKSPLQLGNVGTSVTIFNPDTDDDEEGGFPIRDAPIDYKPRVERNLWMWDVYRKNHGDDQLLTVGDDWNLAVITSAGYSIEQAVNKMYKYVDDFSFVGAYWRPKFDYLSLDYPTSILNRLNYGFDQGLYDIPFTVTVKG